MYEFVCQLLIFISRETALTNEPPPSEHDYSDTVFHLNTTFKAHGLNLRETRKSLGESLLHTTNIYRLLYLEMVRQSSYTQSEHRDHFEKMNNHCNLLWREFEALGEHGRNLFTHQVIALKDLTHMESENEIRAFWEQVLRLQQFLELNIKLSAKLSPGSPLKKANLRNVRHMFIQQAAKDCEDIPKIVISANRTGLFYDVIDILLPVVTGKYRDDLFKIIADALSDEPPPPHKLG